MDIADDHRLAARIAADAGRALTELRAQAPTGGAALGAAGDRRAHDLIVGALAVERPDDAVVSEEGPRAPGPATGGDHRRPRVRPTPPAAGRRRLWVVDPLDGTREYGEGRADFAVHVALVLGDEAVVGAVALPGEGLVFSTAAPLAPLPAGPARPGGVRVAVSRTRPPAEAGRLASQLGAELVAMGSAGAKIMAVVRGVVDVYVHAGGQYEWDSAAPVAVAHAYGVHAARLDGSPLRYGRPDPWLPDLVVCRPEVRDRVGRALGW